MRFKRLICLSIVCVFSFLIVATPANAVEVRKISIRDDDTVVTSSVRATSSLNLSISGRTKALASNSFPMVVGETITIKASFAPFDASLDFGIIAPDGKYYYFNTTGGSIDKTIRVSQSGDYIFQIRNNSDYKVKVSGFVKY